MRRLKSIENARLPRNNSEAHYMFTLLAQRDMSIADLNKALKETKCAEKHNRHSVAAHVRYFAHFIDQDKLANNVVSLNERARSLMRTQSATQAIVDDVAKIADVRALSVQETLAACAAAHETLAQQS